MVAPTAKPLTTMLVAVCIPDVLIVRPTRMFQPAGVRLTRAAPMWLS